MNDLYDAIGLIALALINEARQHQGGRAPFGPNRPRAIKLVCFFFHQEKINLIFKK